MTSTPTSGAPRLRLKVLGPLEVEVKGEPVPIPAGNQRRLLAALALARGHSVSVAALADDVWGPEAPKDVTGSLQTTVARLRRTLGVAAQDLTLSPAGYALGGVYVERHRGLTSSVRPVASASCNARPTS